MLEPHVFVCGPVSVLVELAIRPGSEDAGVMPTTDGIKPESLRMVLGCASWPVKGCGAVEGAYV
jgi:hypothetical protein